MFAGPCLREINAIGKILLIFLLFMWFHSGEKAIE
jgi:hypothetical protein